MSMTDPISDFLTRVRNASLARHSKVDVPASGQIKAITQIFLDEGYIQNFTTIDDNKQGVVRIYLKYGANRKAAIKGMQRVSSPGLRRYVDAQQIPRVLNGFGTAILSTSKGILTDKKARQEKVGGEVLCTIW
ncbi:MAG: 30S ribosomal protein S8 [bacterium]|nr:30S ribosomal protein S8 [bacterium]